MADIEVQGPSVERSEEILTAEALEFVADLHRRFGPRREELLAARAERRRAIAETGTLDFLADTADVRADDWTVAPVPGDLQDRRVEITGPTTTKMSINALNSGAKVWLAETSRTRTRRTGQTSWADRSTCATPYAASWRSPPPRGRTTRSRTPTGSR
jgi:malate synthase